jgi:hypothetical protein
MQPNGIVFWRKVWQFISIRNWLAMRLPELWQESRRRGARAAAAARIFERLNDAHAHSIGLDPGEQGAYVLAGSFVGFLIEK